MLKSTSGTEPSPPPHTRDTAPIKSKVALRLTASQGIDYHSTARTVYLSHHRGGHCRRMGHHTFVDTLYVVITVSGSATYSADKKVLLRERKRHTVRCIASARYAALSPDWGGGGTLFSPGRGGGYPIQS